ncbi:hypothetical protein N0V90_013387 [Kalmusia sp. IMI 367209]|nr:hypothetical protein N0V90_013387 [Kalmusia sp. IMI 367209]
MPPLAHTQDKHPANDLKVKKTKSRNGCGRCKLKRLKCDETTPGCLQCKRRNVPCPGYEKTLKWSTKYEVFQPTQFIPTPSRTGPKANISKPKPKPRVTTFQITPDVERSFEALAAVLPARKHTPEPAPKDNSCQSSPPPLAAVGSLTSSEDDGSPPELESLPEPLFFEDSISLDPSLLDGFVDAMEMHDDELTFGPMEGFDVDPGPVDCINFDTEEFPQPPDEVASTAQSSPRLSRSLLLDFYRLPSPSPSATSVDDVESVLIQHYFKDVCALFSTFDSALNPFRTTILRIYQDTPSIYYAIQSMSAAHLANTFPNMAQVGVDMQGRARNALRTELSLVQSGQLARWQCAWREEFLATARSLILPRLLSNTDGEQKQRETQFFEESLIYWEMLMGFVTPDAMTFAPSGLRARGTPKKVSSARKPDGKIVPHPWTGIAPTIQILFAEVGRLVRRERMREVTSNIDIRRQQENISNAATLEEDLLAAEYPLADEIADLGDEMTSKQDFVVIAEAYRCAGLLELYRVFPSILRRRLGTKKFEWADNVDFKFPTPRYETPYEDTDTKLWLNSLSMHILDMIDSIPSSSGTICIQPILLVAAASELRFVSSVDFFDVYANDAKVRRFREFVVKRLQEYAMRLPAKPLRKMIDLIKEVWCRQDNGDNVFWLDVMDEKGYQTVIG